MKRITILLLLLTASPAWADTHTWTGAAQDVPQITTISPTGTWASGDTAYVEINNKRLTVTLDSTASRIAVVELLRDAIEASAAGSDTDPNDTDGITGTWNAGGLQYGEYYEVDATVDITTDPNAPVLTITSSTVTIDGTSTNGVPFTITAGETTAGSGAVGTPTNTQEASGRFHWDDADNWKDPNGNSVLPGDDDLMYFPSGSQSIYFGMNEAGGVDDLECTRETEYTGTIGLTDTNSWTSSRTYPEYRRKYFNLTRDNATNVDWQVGTQGASGTPSGRTRLEMPFDLTVDLVVYDAAATSSSLGESVQLVGDGKLDATIYKGSLAVGIDSSEETPNLDSLQVGYVSSVASDAFVRVGSNCITTASPSSFVQTGGTVYFGSGKSGGTISDYALRGGTLYFDDPETVSSMVIEDAAVCYYRGGTITNLEVRTGGTFDTRRSSVSGTFTAVDFFSGSKFYDPGGWVTSSSYDFNGCAPEDCTFEIPADQRLTRTSIP